MDITQVYSSTTGRFGRQQFILWALGLGIVVGIIMSMLNRFGSIGIILGAILNIVVIFYFWKSLVMKRAHDLNNEGTARWKKLLIVNCVIIIISTISTLVIANSMPNVKDIEAKVTSIQQQMATADLAKQQELQKEVLDMGVSAIKATTSPLAMGINILAFIAGIYAIYLGWNLVFKKGTAGDNQYGKDPLATTN